MSWHDQDPHQTTTIGESQLEVAIGREVRRHRQLLGMTMSEVSREAGLSTGMLSKIENGQTSPSLETLRRVATALNVPVTSLFRQYEEERDASFVPAGRGLEIERRGTRAGHHYTLLGHTVGTRVTVEPYLISITDEADVFPTFQHDGVEFIHILKGEVDYRHGKRLYK